MDNLTIDDMWKHAIEGYVTRKATDEEIEKFKLFFYSGAYALLNCNHYLQTHSKTKNDYIEAMRKLQDECMDLHNVEKTDKKPNLKIVKNKPCVSSD